MAGSRRLSIEIVGDAKGVGSAFRESETAADSFEKKTTQSFGQFTKSIGDAEGASGKWSAFTGGAMDQVTANAGMLAVAGGAAIAGFAVHAIGQFTNVAKTAIDTGATIGTSAENASRWIAVGDDFGLAAADIESGAKNIVKSLDSQKWEDYGIKTRDAGGHARDTSAILVDTLAVLSGIPEEADRAKAGTDLLGKGWGALAPIVGHTKDEYRDMLDTVEDGQVITKGEADTAEDMRLAQDELGDAIGDVTLAIGGLLAKGAPLLSFLADTISSVADLTGELETSVTVWGDFFKSALGTDDWSEIADGTRSTEDAIIAAGQAALDAGAPIGEVNAKLRELGLTGIESSIDLDMSAQATNAVKRAAADAKADADNLTSSMHGMGEAAREGNVHVTDLNDVLAIMKTRTDEADAAYQTLTGHLDEKDSWATAQTAIYNFHALLAPTQADVDDLARSLGDYVHQTDLIPAEKKTQFLAMLDEGQVAEVERRLAILARNRTMQLDIIAKGGSGNFQVHGIGAEGGIVTRPTRAIIGDNGPEAVIPLSQMPGAYPLGAGMGGGSPVIINVYGSVMTERDLVRSVTDGIIDGQRRGEIPAGAFN